MPRFLSAGLIKFFLLTMRASSTIKKKKTKQNEWEKVAYLQLWWYNTYIGVPVVHSSIDIPDKPGQGCLDLQLTAKMRPNSSSSHLLQYCQQDRWRKVTKQLSAVQPVLFCLRFQQVAPDPENDSASNLICCLWSMHLKWLPLSTFSASWEINQWKVNKIANLSSLGLVN